MAKYHISDDGVARICNPVKTGKCKFGDDKPHFDTKAKAQKAYEKEMSSQSVFYQFEKNKEIKNMKDLIDQPLKSDLTNLKNFSESVKLSANELKAVDYYTTAGYTKINDFLYSSELPIKNKNRSFVSRIMHNNINSKNFDKDDLLNVVRYLDSSIDKANSYSKIVYRGLQSFNGVFNNKPVKDWVNERKIDEDLTFKGFLSSSSTVENAFRRTNSSLSSVIFEIKTNKGLDVSHFSYHKNEKEILLPRDMSFKIVGVHKNIDVSNNFYDHHVSVIQMVEIV